MNFNYPKLDLEYNVPQLADLPLVARGECLVDYSESTIDNVKMQHNGRDVC